MPTNAIFDRWLISRVTFDRTMVSSDNDDDAVDDEDEANDCDEDDCEEEDFDDDTVADIGVDDDDDIAHIFFIGNPIVASFNWIHDTLSLMLMAMGAGKLIFHSRSDASTSKRASPVL